MTNNLLDVEDAITPPSLAGVTWDDLALVTVDTNGLTAVVELVEGWYGTPDVETHDVNRELMSGLLYGPKTANGREIVITGAAVGPREQLMDFRAALAARAAATVPAALEISDPWLGNSLAATVRASTGLETTFIGHNAFRYTVTLMAADTRLYESTWRHAVIRLSGGGETGRRYPRRYSWQYAGTEVAGSARLTNIGNVPAPVQAIYTGALSESYLTDGENTLHVAAIDSGVQILISTDTLVAQAAGGATRASYVLAGSAPLLVPPLSTVTWRVLGVGAGSIDLYWRGAYA